jgi:hypothetical protein
MAGANPTCRAHDEFILNRRARVGDSCGGLSSLTDSDVNAKLLVRVLHVSRDVAAVYTNQPATSALRDHGKYAQFRYTQLITHRRNRSDLLRSRIRYY